MPLGFKISGLGPVWWYMPVIPSTGEVEAGGTQGLSQPGLHRKKTKG
jgi:hypothetical protein